MIRLLQVLFLLAWVNLASGVVVIQSVDGDFSPDDVTGLELWLDGADTATLWQNTAGSTAVTTSGDSVQRWDDKSSNGWDVTEGTNNPEWANPGVLFTKADSERLVSSTLTVSEDDAHFFIVFENNSTGVPGFDRFMGWSGGTVDYADQNGLAISMDNDNDDAKFDYHLFASREMGVSTSSSSISDGTIYLLEVYIDFASGTSQLWLDGTSIGTDTGIAGANWAPTDFMLGRENDTAGGYLQGTLYSILMYDSEITGSDLTSIRDYLDTQFTIPGL